MEENRDASPVIARWVTAGGEAEPASAPAGPRARPDEDPAAAWERYKLQVALHDRETDLAESRRNYHSALDDRAGLSLEVEILRGTVKDREADLAKARQELREALLQAAHLKLDRDILESAIADREADLAQSRREAAEAAGQAAHLVLDRDMLRSALDEREADLVKAQQEAQRYIDDMARLALKLQLLEDASAERTALAATTETPDGFGKPRGRLAQRFDDLTFFIKYMINAHNY